MTHHRKSAILSFRYHWGLFESLDDFDLSKMKKSISLSEPGIPMEIASPFNAEKITEFSGEYGDQSVGDPVEIDFFQAQTTEGEIRIHIFNRAISMLGGNATHLVRLHRHFCAIQKFCRGRDN